MSTKRFFASANIAPFKSVKFVSEDTDFKSPQYFSTNLLILFSKVLRSASILGLCKTSDCKDSIDATSKKPFRTSIK